MCRYCSLWAWGKAGISAGAAVSVGCWARGRVVATLVSYNDPRRIAGGLFSLVVHL